MKMDRGTDPHVESGHNVGIIHPK